MKRWQIEPLIEKILRRDKRYNLEAYELVSDALDYAQNKLIKKRHITGQELSQAFVKLCLERYGNMARYVLEQWGLYRIEDVGEIVFNLVEVGILSKQPDDTKADFESNITFVNVFDRADID